MKYYLIAGEASGDLHAASLMHQLRKHDGQAEFRYFGGDLMHAEGGTLVRHYREMAYMGFVPVLLHLDTILGNMSLCKRDIVQWGPDCLILVDYPGFNLSIAKYISAHTSIPIYYYISPKLWAWKEYRIKTLRKCIRHVFSILPFETDYFRGKEYARVTYVGNPSVDEIATYKELHKGLSHDERCRAAGIADPSLPVLALLPGSRKQEIRDNLRRMLQAADRLPVRCQVVIAGAPGIDPAFYSGLLDGREMARVLFGRTYDILSAATLAMVTSGTATLETALFDVPQVVCYYTSCGRLVSWLRKRFLKVKYVSLVNLIAGREVVRELIAGDMTPEALLRETSSLLSETRRQQMQRDYADMRSLLGPAGAPDRAAAHIVRLLHASHPTRP